MNNTENKIEIFKRTFDALKYLKGSAERNELNKNIITSEYMKSYKYAVVGPNFTRAFKTESAATTYKERIEKHNQGESMNKLETLVNQIKEDKTHNESNIKYLELYKHIEEDLKVDITKLYIAFELQSHMEEIAIDEIVEIVNRLWLDEFDVSIAELCKAVAGTIEKDYSCDPYEFVLTWQENKEDLINIIQDILCTY